MKIYRIASQTYQKVESYLTTLLNFYKRGGEKSVGDSLMINYFQHLAASLHYIKRLDEVLDEYLPEVPMEDPLENQVRFIRNLFKDIYDPSHPVRRWLFDVGPHGSNEKDGHTGFFPNTVLQNYFKEEVDNPYKNVRDKTFKKHVPYIGDF